MSAPTFQWYQRGLAPTFDRTLAFIRDQFRETCGIGSHEFWQNFVDNDKINLILTLRTGPKQTVTGFVAIKKGYRCIPDVTKPGFSICSYDHDDTWYIELICAQSHQMDGIKGKGGWLLDEVRQKATSEGIQFITLSALPYVVTYYYDRGYRLSMDVNCKEPAELTMLAKRIREKMTEGKFGVPNVEPLHQPFHDSDFIEFLKLAVTKGFTSNRHMFEGEYLAETQTDVEENAVDGVYMTLCLPKREFEFTAPNKMRTFSQWAQEMPLDQQDFDASFIDFQGREKKRK